MLTKIEKFQEEILNRNNTMFMTFVLTNVFYLSFMFLVHFMPTSMGAGLSAIASSIVAAIIMLKVTTVAGVEGQESLAEKLRYFPINKGALRKAQYSILIKIILIQLALTMIPIVVTCFRFNLKNTCVVLGTTIVTMVLIGVFFVERNLYTFGRK